MRWFERPFHSFALLAGLLGLAAPAAADSDGYFCVAKGYLAFELRSFDTPALKGPHVLKVVRFGSPPGISWAGEVELEAFQTHEMRCEATQVEIAGWGKGYVKYAIDVAGVSKLTIMQHIQDPQRIYDSSKEGPEPGNLGNWAKPGVFPLDSADPVHLYQLVFTDMAKPGTCHIDHHHKTELVQVDSLQIVSQRVLLFEGTFVESGCD